MEGGAGTLVLGGVMNTTDPVFQRNGLWYFYDETWANEYGPFATEAIARDECDKYARTL